MPQKEQELNILKKCGCKNIKFNTIYKAVTLILSLVLLFSAVMTGTLAWQDFDQHKTNSASGSDMKRTVLLHKYEKDANGVVTAVTVKDAEFYLYDDNDTQMGSRYVTDENGRININEIEPGDYYFLETNPSYAYTFDNDGEKEINKYPFSVKKTDVNVVVHAFNQRITADLIVAKVVKNADGTSLTNSQLTEQFSFTVTFSDGGSYPYTMNGINKATLASGGTIKLKHGEKALFTGLPVGILYTVRETPVPGYVISSNNHQGNIPVGGVTALFTNTYDRSALQMGSLSVSKTVTGPEADKEKNFIFTVTFSDGKIYSYQTDGATKTPDSSGRFTLKHNQSAVFDNLPLGITYTVAEDDYMPDYMTNGQNTTGTITKDGAAAVFINHRTMLNSDSGFLTVSKKVTGSGDKNRAFYFTILFGDGGTYTYYVGDEEHVFISGSKISLKHGQTAIFAGLPVGLHYTVTEDNYSTDGYITSADNASGTIILGEFANAVFTNDKPGEGETKLIVKKKVIGEISQADVNREFDFKVIINGTETKFKLKDGQQGSFNLPYGAVYEVIEENYIEDNYLQSTITNGYGTADNQTIEVIKTNSFIGTPMIEINGKKTWNMSADQSAPKPDSITVYLKNVNTVVDSRTVTPDSDGNWAYTFTAPKYDVQGNIIKYTLEEKPVAGFESIVKGYDIENIYVPLTSVKVTKEWIGRNPNQPKSIKVQLYKDDVPYGRPVTLSVSNYWTHIWSRLDNNAKWKVDELGVPDHYTRQIKGNAKDGFMIRNVFDGKTPPSSAGKVTIRGQKLWNHGTNPEANQPRTITIHILADGKRFISLAMNKESHWRYSLDLPKYNKDGKEIVYTVDEDAVKDYQKSIDGYDITNTHRSVSDSNNPENQGNSPNTGDNTNLWPIIGSVIILLIMLLMRRKLSYKSTKYI